MRQMSSLAILVLHALIVVGVIVTRIQDMPEAQEMIENEQGFIDNDYGQQSI